MASLEPVLVSQNVVNLMSLEGILSNRSLEDELGIEIEFFVILDLFGHTLLMLLIKKSSRCLKILKTVLVSLDMVNDIPLHPRVSYTS